MRSSGANQRHSSASRVVSSAAAVITTSSRAGAGCACASRASSIASALPHVAGSAHTVPRRGMGIAGPSTPGSVAAVDASAVEAGSGFEATRAVSGR